MSRLVFALRLVPLVCIFESFHLAVSPVCSLFIAHSASAPQVSLTTINPLALCSSNLPAPHYSWPCAVNVTSFARLLLTCWHPWSCRQLLFCRFHVCFILLTPTYFVSCVFARDFDLFIASFAGSNRMLCYTSILCGRVCSTPILTVTLINL